MATKYDANTRLIGEIYRDKAMALFRRRPHRLREALEKSRESGVKEVVRPPVVKH
jgi:hypothetical protein